MRLRVSRGQRETDYDGIISPGPMIVVICAQPPWPRIAATVPISRSQCCCEAISSHQCYFHRYRSLLLRIWLRTLHRRDLHVKRVLGSIYSWFAQQGEGRRWTRCVMLSFLSSYDQFFWEKSDILMLHVENTAKDGGNFTASS